MNAEVQNFCVCFDRYMNIEKGVVDVFLDSNDCIVQYST